MDTGRFGAATGALLAIEGVVFGGLVSAGSVSGALAGAVMGVTALSSGLVAAFGGRRSPA